MPQARATWLAVRHSPNPADTPRKMPMSSLRLLAPLLGLALSVPAGAQNIDLPIRKEGLWQMSTIVSGAPATTSTLCMDKSFSKEMLQMGGSMQKELCSRNEMTRDGDKVHMQSVCKFGESTATSKGTAVFSGDTAYRMDMQSSYNPPMMGMKEAKTTVEAKWLGPCKPGQKPGDVTMANGMTFNIRAMGGKGN